MTVVFADSWRPLVTFPDFQPVVNRYLGQNHDLGGAYAYLRTHWWGFLDGKEEVYDRKMRQDVLRDGRIIRKNVPPRRVWDLHANRVVPYWVFKRGDVEVLMWGISHAWMDEKDREDVWTPINGYEWPVPMPKDADLNHIRIEMLNLGAEYAWLDVLCLRQKYAVREAHREEDMRKEHLRVEEWKLDVPTIGYVYDSGAPVVCYLCGLGRPLSLTSGYFESDRCWFKRAWTLQEINPGCRVIIGGDTGNDIIRMEFQVLLRSLVVDSVEDTLAEMQRRLSTNSMDKVAGLVYRLNTRYIPIYDSGQSEESAWEDLVQAMEYSTRIRLFYCYPEPGDGNAYWYPSWTQVRNAEFISFEDDKWSAEVFRTEREDGQEPGTDWHEGPFINSATVRGLADSSNNEKRREGELVVKDDEGAPHKFKIAADHHYSIPDDDSYTLLGTGDAWYTWSYFWVVGKRRPDGMFEKLSVLEVADKDDVYKLWKLGIIQGPTKTFLC
ncbi:uncharacterized protein EV420DRAFT_1279300 [Desarmillaria tabescens]|uniref:Heterokaryon incompatibility domain-containing protein n=1 Tax=Armillaria tabescens TaxID=1929756 RepID=A0AA39JCF0_ARMTA|nr:uncharacterized protein EV420DRAFT_1279300 [Desarmillaria tabescens]KAK0440033.1 hypothetical protein EV420DRAFT_1279300 [Desarmillaria tabescens]